MPQVRLTEDFMDLQVGTILDVVAGHRSEDGSLWGLLRTPDGAEIWIPSWLQQVVPNPNPWAGESRGVSLWGEGERGMDPLVTAARPPFPFWVRISARPALDMLRVGDRVTVFDYRDGRYLTLVGGTNRYWVEEGCVEAMGDPELQQFIRENRRASASEALRAVPNDSPPTPTGWASWTSETSCAEV